MVDDSIDGYSIIEIYITIIQIRLCRNDIYRDPELFPSSTIHYMIQIEMKQTKRKRVLSINGECTNKKHYLNGSNVILFEDINTNEYIKTTR